ncbi:MAG TPA: MFS transporter [Opitutaceae bacterium]|nr:MFS transporter [Opitutaceae bacterium]
MEKGQESKSESSRSDDDRESAAGEPSRIVAGFWEKAGAWALPRDSRGEGYGPILRERWVEISFCTLFVFASSWGQTFLLSIFQPSWREELSLSKGAMGALYGGATLASGLLLPLAGRWLDRAPSDRAAAVTLAGLAIGGLIAAAASEVWMLALALFALRFFGQGLSANVGVTRAARWFEHNRGKAVSLAGLGFPLGEAVLPAVVTILIGVMGWRWAWVALAGIAVAVLGPVAYALLRRRRAARGLSKPLPTRRTHDHGARGSLMRDWRFYGMLAVTAPVPFVGTGVIFFQGTIAADRGWPASVFPTGFILFAVIRALFSLSAGAWVDRVGSLRLLAAPTTLFALGLVLLTQPSPAFAFGFFALLGVGFGAASGVMTTAWTDLFGAHRIGLVKSLSSSFAVICAALAPIVFGYALDAGVSIESILWICAAAMVAISWPMSVILRRGSPAFVRCAS